MINSKLKEFPKLLISQQKNCPSFESEDKSNLTATASAFSKRNIPLVEAAAGLVKV